MSDERKRTLENEETALKFLLKFHTDHKTSIWDDPKEADEYINAVLDRLLEIKHELSESSKKE